MKKSYQTPQLHVKKISARLMLDISAVKGGGTDDPTSDQSKAFWGPSLFDEEEDEEYVDEIVP